MTLKIKTSKIVLLVLGCLLVAFVLKMIDLYERTGGVPDTLIQYTLGAGGVEALAMAGIKIGKTVAGKKDPEE